MVILVQMDTLQEERKITNWSAQGKNYRTNRRAQEIEILTNRRAHGEPGWATAGTALR